MEATARVVGEINGKEVFGVGISVDGFRHSGVGRQNGVVGLKELERDGVVGERSGFVEKGVELERDGDVSNLVMVVVVIVVVGRGLCGYRCEGESRYRYRCEGES